MLHDVGNRGVGLGIVDIGRLAVDAKARRERRLEARLALLAFDRFDQRRFLAADIGAVAMVRVEVEAEAGAEQVFAEEARRARLVQRLLEEDVVFPDFAVDVVVADPRA